MSDAHTLARFLASIIKRCRISGHRCLILSLNRRTRYGQARSVTYNPEKLGAASLSGNRNWK